MKITPKGIESSMQTLFGVIHGLNMHFIRSQIGITINNNFVNVTKEHIDDYSILTAIELACAFIPLIYIYMLVPSVAKTDEILEQIQMQGKNSNCENCKQKNEG